MKIYYPKILKGSWFHFFAFTIPYLLPILAPVTVLYIIFGLQPYIFFVYMFFAFSWKIYVLTALILITFRNYIEENPKMVFAVLGITLISYYFLIYDRVLYRIDDGFSGFLIVFGSFLYILMCFLVYAFLLKRRCNKNYNSFSRSCPTDRMQKGISIAHK